MLSSELRKVADDLGLNYNYNDESKMIYGNYKGYKVIVTENSIYQTYSFKIPCKLNNDYQMRYLNDFVGELLFIDNVKLANYQNRSIVIEISGDTNEAAKNITDMLDKVINFLQTNSYETCCEFAVPILKLVFSL